MVARGSGVFAAPGDSLEWYAAHVNREFIGRAAECGDQRGRR